MLILPLAFLCPAWLWFWLQVFYSAGVWFALVTSWCGPYHFWSWLGHFCCAAWSSDSWFFDVLLFLTGVEDEIEHQALKQKLCAFWMHVESCWYWFLANVAKMSTLRVSSRSKRIPRIDLTVLTLWAWADEISNCYVRQEPFLGHPWSTQLEPNRFSLRACWRCLLESLGAHDVWWLRVKSPQVTLEMLAAAMSAISPSLLLEADLCESYVWPCSPLTFWGPSG